MKKGDKLYCHNNDKHFENILIAGKYYIISDITYNREIIYIICEDKRIYNFTLNIDRNGLSYKTWFCDIIEYRKLKIKQLEKLQ